MRFLQFTSFLVLAALSSNAYSMELIEENLAKTYVVKSHESLEDTVNYLLTATTPPEHILLEGTLYTPEEYYMVVGANDANHRLGHKYKVDLEKNIRDSFMLDEDGIYTPKTKRSKDLHTLLNRDIKLFPYDENLKFLLTLILCEEKVLDISFVAHALIKNYYATPASKESSYEEMLRKKYEKLYLKQVKLIK